MDKNFKKHTFEAGDCIIREGDQSHFAYLIVNGEVEIRHDMLGDNPHTIAHLSKGDVFGEISLFDGLPNMASAVAIRDTTVNILSENEFHRRVAAMDPLMRGILKTQIKRIRKLLEKITDEDDDLNWSDWKKK